MAAGVEAETTEVAVRKRFWHWSSGRQRSFYDF